MTDYAMWMATADANGTPADQAREEFQAYVQKQIEAGGVHPDTMAELRSLFLELTDTPEPERARA